MYPMHVGARAGPEQLQCADLQLARVGEAHAMWRVQRDPHMLRRYGTDMQLEPSLADTRVMLQQLVPLIDECAVKARLLAAGPRGMTPQLEREAAEERRPSTAELQRFALDVRECTAPAAQRIAATAALLGRRLVLLWLPMEIRAETLAAQVRCRRPVPSAGCLDVSTCVRNSCCGSACVA